MTRTKNNILFVLPIILIMLASCTGSVDREWGAINESSSIITIDAVLVGETEILSQSIDPGQSIILAITQEDKGNSEAQQPYEVFSFFRVTKSDTIFADLDWADIHSWDIFIEQTKSNPPQYMQEYYMIVTNADF